jgi:hypothetical protein
MAPGQVRKTMASIKVVLGERQRMKNYLFRQSNAAAKAAEASGTTGQDQTATKDSTNQ